MISTKIKRRLGKVAPAVLLAAYLVQVPALADESPAPAPSAEVQSSSSESKSIAGTNQAYFWDETHVFTLLPKTLLWTPALAGQDEPRSSLRISSLTSNDKQVDETEIGGTFPLMRFSYADQQDKGLQVDMFALVKTRFADLRHQEAVDYRFGVPFTYAHGDWSFKAGWEHTSCHLGDELHKVGISATPRSSNRDDFMIGIAYRPIESVRVYGTWGYAFHLSSFTGNDDHERFSLGAEWTHPGASGIWGKPYAALEVECRGDEDYTPNFTAQLGWRWADGTGRPSERIALEYYDGRSIYGQFIDRHESWVSLGFFFDF